MPHHTQPKRKKRGKRPEMQYAFCHQCKQRVPEAEVFTCAYNHGPAVPEKMTEGGVVAYNIEAYNTRGIDYLVKHEMKSHSKSKKALVDPSYFVPCERVYCEQCIRYFYEQEVSQFCPFC